MKITRIKSFAVTGPLTDLCFVKVETDDPTMFGWGEASLPTKCPAVAQAVRDMEGLLIGFDPLRTEFCWQRMYRHSYWRGGPILSSSISGIDIALWDIKGKVLDVPVCDLLGGAVRDHIRPYANLGLSSDPTELRRRARHAVGQGYRRVKFYPLTAVHPVEDAAAIDNVARCCAAVREEMGTEGSFCLDFHGRCSPGLAIQIERAVRDTQPMWIEEPVAPENLAGLQSCARSFVVPIAAGERWFTRWGFLPAMEQRLVSIVQPDVANAGGISELARIADMAETYGIAFAPHNPNGPVQSLASIHLSAAKAAFTILEHRHDQVAAMRRFSLDAPDVGADQTIVVPRRSGLGIELDEDQLSAMACQVAVLESFRDDGSIADW
jgi:galactonate dehydratase